MKRLTQLNTAAKRWPLVVVVLLAAGMALSLFAFRHRMPYTARTLGPPQLPSAVMRIKDARILALSRGAKLWSLRANTAELSRDRRLVSLMGIEQGVVYQGHTPVLNVEAGVITYDTFSGNLLVSRGVCVRGQEGQVISTEGLKWDTSSTVLVTTAPVRFRSSLGSVAARALKLDLRSRELKLVDVSGSMSVESTF